MNFIQRNYLKVIGVASAMLGLSAFAAKADTLPSATSTMSILGGGIIGTLIDFAIIIYQQYWPYALMSVVIVGLLGITYYIVAAPFRHHR